MRIFLNVMKHFTVDRDQLNIFLAIAANLS